MTPYLLIFLAGLAGSLHCVGMCGAFACALGAGARGLGRHLLYNLGRLATYCFLGAVLGQAGVLLVGHGGEATGASLAQRALALAAGGLMVWAGLQFFGLGRPRPGAGGAWLAQALRGLLRAPGAAMPLALGVANGFLPCPLVYAFAAQAAASGGAVAGLATMAAFGLGTFPALFLVGALGARWRLGSVRLAGALIVGFGAITLARGLLPFGPHLHL